MRTWTAFAALALGAVPGALAADLTLGTAVNGALESTDVMDDQGKYQDIFNLTLEAGQTVIITATGQNIDSYLIVRSPSGETLEDDDSGGSLNPRVIVTGSEAGTYKVTVTTFAAATVGSYTLLASEGQRQELALGTPVPLALTGAPITLTLAVAEGQAALLQGSDADFDVTLTVATPGGVRLVGDDYSGQRRPRVLVPGGPAGNVTVVVGSYGDPRGNVTVTATPVTPAQRIELAGGATSVTPLELAPGTEGLIVAMSAPAESRLIVSADSQDFVTQLLVLAPTTMPGQAASPLVNRARLGAPASGEIWLEIRPYQAGTGGTVDLVAFDLGPGRLPAFSLPDLEGNPVDSSQFQGQVRVIDIYASWDQSHGNHVQVLNQLASEYQGRAVVLGIGQGDNRGALAEDRDSTQIAYPVLVDEMSTTCGLFGDQTADGSTVYTPSTLVVAADGTITQAFVGTTPTADQLRTAIGEALGEGH